MRSATASWGTFCNYPWSDQLLGFLWRTVSEHPVSSTKKVLFFSLKTAPSTISLTSLFIPQEMAASLVFFCSAPKIRKHEISGGAEILKDRLNNAFLIRFSRESIAICCATETVCAVVTPGLWVCHHRDESLVGAPVVSQLAACLWWDLEVWTSSAAEPWSSQQLRVLLSQPSAAKEVSSQNLHLHF